MKQNALIVDDEKDDKQETLRHSDQKSVDVRVQLADFQRMLNLVGSPEAASILSRPDGLSRLSTSSAQNRDLLDRLSDGFALLSADGTLDYYNPVFAQLLSLPADIPAETRLLGLEHLAACRPFADALKSALSGMHQNVHCALTDEQGHRRILECAATAVPEGTNQFTVVLVIRDQTEREQTLAHLTALNNVVAALSRSPNFEQQLGFALTACREATASDAAVIYLIGADPQQLTLARGDGFTADTIALLKESPLTIGQGELAQVAVDGQPRAIADLRSMTTMYPELTQREQVISGAFVPLRDGQNISGVLGIFTRTRRLFTEADIRLLTSMASQVGLSLHNARLHEQMRAQAQTDALTGLFNRGHLMELAEREYQRARRRRSPLIVLMIDVDQFKSVNDSSGHAAGDHALRAVARMLREHIRTVDLVGRYGGDEFVVLLVDCTHAYAFEIIRRLHQAAQIIRVPPDTNRITISLGIGMAACRLTENETLEQVLAQAARELYAIKNRSA